MKKYAVLMSAFLFLTAAGCSDAPQTQEQETTGFKIYVDEFTEAPTEAASETNTSESEASAETEASEPAETTVSETDAPETSAASEESSEEHTESAQDAQETAAAASEADEEILGTWSYADGYGFQFMENNQAVITADYSDVFHFESGQMYYSGSLYPLHIAGNIISFTYEDETMLVLEAESAIDPANLNGRYRIGECAFRENLASADAENISYIEVSEERFQLMLPIQYRISDETICLVQNGSELMMTYFIDEEGLHMVDENGVHDLLTRAE